MKYNVLENFSFRKIMHSLWLGPLGALLAWYIGAPAPFLIGPTAVCSIAALLGLKFFVPVLAKNLSFIVIGLTIGSNVTPESLTQASKWPFSIICMVVSVLLITIFGRYFLYNLFSLDKKSCVLASSPGHLTFVLNISHDIGGDTAKIAVIQSTRVLTLTLVTPLIVMLFNENVPLEQTINPNSLIPFFDLFFLMAVSAILGLFVQKTNIPAPYLIAGMFCSTLSNGTGLTSGEVLPMFSIIAFVILGTLIGTRFVSVNLSLLRSSFFGGISLTLIGALFSFLFAYITHKVTNLNLADTIIAFAPGGLETMIAMGNLVNADPTYVAIHHISRIFFLSFLVPFLIYNKGQP